MSTHNLSFGAKKKKHVYPCKPQFCCIKVGYEGGILFMDMFPDAYNVHALSTTKVNPKDTESVSSASLGVPLIARIFTLLIIVTPVPDYNSDYSESSLHLQSSIFRLFLSIAIMNEL